MRDGQRESMSVPPSTPPKPKTWSDAWHRALQRRVRMWLAAIVCSIVMAVAFLIFLGVFVATLFEVGGAGGEGTLMIGLLLATPAIAILLPTALVFRRLRTERTILRLVPEHDGMLCPGCRVPLTESDGGFRCPRCDKTLGAEVREHWQQYPHQQGRVQMLLRTAHPLIWSIRNRLWVGVVLLVALWLVLSFLWTAWSDELLVVALLEFVPLLFFGIGMQLTGLGWKRRVGDSRHCVACDYEKAGEAGGERCPECGSAWAEPGALVRGRVVRSLPLFWVGVLLAAIYPASQVPGFMGRNAWERVTPTWLLFEQIDSAQHAGHSSHEKWAGLAARPLSVEDQQRLTDLLIDEIVAAPRGFVTDEWAVLRGRALTREQELRFFEGLLDKRERKGFLSDDDKRWLDAMVRSGTVPEDLARRYSQ